MLTNANVLWADSKWPLDALKVKSYLEAMEARNLEAALSCWVGPGVTIQTPGGRTVTSLQDQVAFSARRYQLVGKKNTDYRFFAMGSNSLVICAGELHGKDVHGTPFSGVRFVDIFTMIGGLIVLQEIYNDIGSSALMSGDRS